MVTLWLWFNTEPVSEREVTTDRCHPLVGPYTPLVQGMSGKGEREMTREVEWCVCLLSKLCLTLCFCVLGAHVWAARLRGHVQKMRAPGRIPNMFLFTQYTCMKMPFLRCSILSVCMRGSSPQEINIPVSRAHWLES